MSGTQRASVRRRVHTGRQTRHHQSALSAQVKAELLRHAQAVVRAKARAHHGHGGLLVKQRQFAPPVEQQRRLKNVPQPLGVPCVVHGQNENILSATGVQDPSGGIRRLVLQRPHLPRGESSHLRKRPCVGQINILR